MYSPWASSTLRWGGRQSISSLPGAAGHASDASLRNCSPRRAHEAAAGSLGELRASIEVALVAGIVGDCVQSSATRAVSLQPILVENVPRA
jgi:hypothetical protein